ncbi:MAG: hypothetical protein ACR2PI_27585 [Hyphomicrobiaceae bacterium]
MALVAEVHAGFQELTHRKCGQHRQFLFRLIRRKPEKAIFDNRELVAIDCPPERYCRAFHLHSAWLA